MKNPTIEFVREEFLRLKGYKLITDVYINRSTKMQYQCPRHPNEELWMTYAALKNGYGCKFCASELKRLALARTHEQFLDELKIKNEHYDDMEIIGKYINSSTPIECRCKIHDYTWFPVPYSLLGNHGCKYCGYNQPTIEFVSQEFLRLKGYILLEEVYIDNKTPMRYQCPKHPDEELYISWSSFQNGCGCKLCNSEKNKLDFEFVKDEFMRLKGYEILEEVYIDNETPMKYRCPHHPNENLFLSYHNLKSGHGCKFCWDEARIKPFLYNIDDIIEVKSGKVRILEQFKKQIGNVNKVNLVKYYKYECLKCGYIGEKREDGLRLKESCSACSGREVFVGFNSIHDTNPKLESLLLNKADAYRYTQTSNERTDFICQFCGNIIYDKNIKSIFRRGLACNVCGNKGGSFPERFMANILNEFDLKVKTEQYFDWCIFKLNGKDYHGRYDFVFELNNQNYIVETDGGFGHGKNVHYKSKLTNEDCIYRDKMKDKLAKENGYEIIRIDCHPSEFTHIKNSIINSKLNELFDLSKVDWDKCLENAQTSIVKQSWDLLNNGKSLLEIMQILNKSRRIVIGYLEIGTKIGKCNYISEQHQRKTSKKCVCITTKEIFSSITDAAKYYSMADRGHIGHCCRGKSKSSGIHPITGEKLLWAYYDDETHKDFKLVI